MFQPCRAHASAALYMMQVLMRCGLTQQFSRADFCAVQCDQLSGRGAAAARGEEPAAAVRSHLQRRSGLHQLAARSKVRPLHPPLLIHPCLRRVGSSSMTLLTFPTTGQMFTEHTTLVSYAECIYGMMPELQT